MVYAALILAFAGLTFGLRRAGFAEHIGAMLSGMRHTVGVMRSDELHEQEKEARIQRAARDMFGEFLTIAERSLAVMAGPALFMLLCVSLGLFSVEEVEAAATNGYFLVASTLLMLAVWRVFE